MTFNDFISEVHGFVEDGTITKKQTLDVVEAFVEALIEQVCEQENVHVTNLGIFKYNERKARKGRNPKTGESINIPVKAAVSFKIAKSFKDQLATIKVA